MDLRASGVFDRLVDRQSRIPQKEDITYTNAVKNLAKYHFEIKAVIQDILECRESMEALNELNEKGRAKISQLRDEIENLELYARDIEKDEYIVKVESERYQLASTLKQFKNANMRSLFAIEKAQRDDLLRQKEGEDSTLRNRKKVDRDGLLKMSSGVTEQLLSISRQLADTAQRSQDTLDNLVSSSSTVHGTQSELENTAGSISQSSKLLKKYGRREFTDKVIMFFAFLFFLAVCLYIVQRRLF
ncbi:hypothetical protein JYU34_007229 [Plutella xylostella]|uniref:Sec20 C-terminal domain-containing protein n=1 Tax=Plutella xylostella TaxID=51655 RepID=A0ABQ7QPY4_PLUXY|nr:vesicle transport protein SEC20 [Plutella xylostella]KAG7307093.1 hypothetical protein JYU34_007229 [Plutella xylostella]